MMFWHQYLHATKCVISGFDHLKFLLNIQVGSKRKRAEDCGDVTKGAERARQFLKEFSEIPLDKMEFEEALQQVSKLKQDLEKDAVNCSWLQQFF